MDAKSPMDIFANDAKKVRASDDLRVKLVNIVRDYHDRDPERIKYFLPQIAPILEDFGKKSINRNDLTIDKIDYMCKEILKSGLIWGISVFLAWLCFHHIEVAERFYAEAELAKEGIPYTKYPGRPGDWAAKNHGVKIANLDNDANNVDLGPIFPKNYSQQTPKKALITRDDVAAPILFPHRDGICNAAFSPCGRFIVTSGKARAAGANAFIWDIENLSANSRKYPVSRFTHEDVLSAIFDANSRFILWVTGRLAFLSYADSLTQPLFTIEHAKQISHCSFSNNGDRIVTASWDKTACIWDSKTGKHLEKITPNVKRNHVINSVYFSPDDSDVILAASDGNIHVFSIDKACITKTLSIKDPYWLCGAMYSRDGTRILSAGPEDGSAHIWDLSSGTIKTTLGGDEAHTDTIWSAEFSSDEKFVVTASDDRRALVWGAENASVMIELKHPAKLYAAHFSPDDTHVLTACDDGSAYLWKIR